MNIRNRQNKLCKVVSEVSSFVGNPVYIYIRNCHVEHSMKEELDLIISDYIKIMFNKYHSILTTMYPILSSI